jgi:hypothetical protein
MKTEAMNINDITNTGTGPTLIYNINNTITIDKYNLDTGTVFCVEFPHVTGASLSCWVGSCLFGSAKIYINIEYKLYSIYTYVAFPCLCRTVPAAPATRPAPALGLLLPLPTVVCEAGAGILNKQEIID